MEKQVHNIELIRKAIELGYELDDQNAVAEEVANAADYIVANGNEVWYHTELDCNSHQQSYIFVDSDGFTHETWGEIFNFTAKYRSSDNKYFRREGDAFVPVNYWEIPDDTAERQNYVFVFDRIACVDGTVAVLYDYLK